MTRQVQPADRFGFVRHALDVHLLGIVSAASLLEACGQPVAIADSDTCRAFAEPDNFAAIDRAVAWIRDHRIACLGLSYRLDPEQGTRWAAQVCHNLRVRRMFAANGGSLHAVFFAGLPDTCAQAQREVREITDVFAGDETPAETLARLGIPPIRWPNILHEGMRYDEDRLSLGRELTQNGRHLSISPVNRGGYTGFGTHRDTLVARVDHARRCGQPPLFRAHVGPYRPNRAEAVALFTDWAGQLARAGHLDILSIGTSQLTQSAFGEDWADRPNGGGVPLNTPEEYSRIWEVSRPMLVRTYAGTRDIRKLAAMHESTLNMAWHALSLWWFCRIDGRGPNTVRANLDEHAATLRYIAATGKPFEPNVAHHFSFRGADDVSAVASAVLAARFAKHLGIRTLVLQVMLNTPRATWGVQDLAKARAALLLARELEDAAFRVILQPRAGLDSFSPDDAKARAQLAASTTLMDDIEPDNPQSPPVIHVVSYSEATHLANPSVVNESIQIARYALDEYRRRKREGSFAHAAAMTTAADRTRHLVSEARLLLAAIERQIPNLDTPAGLYAVFQRGFFAVPHLLECRKEFARAIRWQTRLVNGGVVVVDDEGKVLSTGERLVRLADTEAVPSAPSDGSGGENDPGRKPS